MFKRDAELVSGLTLVWDLLCLGLVWSVARLSEMNSGKSAVMFETWTLIPLSIAWVFSAWLFRLHKSQIGQDRGGVRELLAGVSFFSGLGMGLWSFSTEPPPLAAYPAFWFMCLLAVVGARTSRLFALRVATSRGLNRRNILIVGTETFARDVARRLRAAPNNGCVVVGYVSESAGEVGRRYDNIPVIGTFSDVPRLSLSNIDLVMFCLPSHLEPHADKLLHELRNSTVDVTLIPALAGTETLGLEAYMFEGLPIVTLQAAKVYGWNRALKRALDILGATAALLLCAPLWVGIALAIKATSSGPVLYRQTRMSLAGQPFVMLKFRTMRRQAERESGPVWASPPGDPRVTKIGRILRKTSLDELPQFWNVLKGDMSLVGPRPERPTFINTFRQAYPAYMLRLKVKAGMTGWAQINGWRGNTCLQTRIAHDLYYIEHWSLWFDLKILLQTLWKGMIHEHSC